ncbi:hypothetical protein EV580_1314 [Mycobacterium sp. BK086]|nr:hypothetical protein EV580_1314 [Mycobacterium sp. BK086]
MAAREAVAEVRCAGGALQFKVIDGHTLEVKCNDRRCTTGNSVALHRYSLPDCKPIETLTFQDPFSGGHRARKHRKDHS